MEKAESLSFPRVIGSGGRGQSIHNKILVGSKPFLDRCVSAILKFSGNEFELGENKIEREREPIILSI
jgi:hypothetical protein